MAPTTTTPTPEVGFRRVLVGGIGYRFLRDESVGPYMADTLGERAPEGVEVEDFGYHPVGLHQNLTDREPYDRLIIVAAPRRGREPGTITIYQWDRVLPSPEEIQVRVSEAVTGVIDLDGLLVVVGALGGFPDDVVVIEVEPGEEGWGDSFSELIAARLPAIEEAVWTSTLP